MLLATERTERTSHAEVIFSANVRGVDCYFGSPPVLGDAVLNAKSMPTAKFVAFLLVACVAARLRIKLPGVTGTMSVNLPFILVAAAEMNTAEALAVGFISTFVQCLAKGKKFNRDAGSI